MECSKCIISYFRTGFSSSNSSGRAGFFYFESLSDLCSNACLCNVVFGGLKSKVLDIECLFFS